MKKVIGILSGTSIDSVDVVLTSISGNAGNRKIKVLKYLELPFDKKLRTFIMKCSNPEESNIADICKLNFLLGRYFGCKINEFIRSFKISRAEIDYIGSHGQTVYHYPFNEKFRGISMKSTLQAGDPSVIANLTGITTVGDFRNADIAVNGNGAPLVPYLDYVLFKSDKKNRLLINIGGIANLTYLKKNCEINDVIAFDTGPGNMLIDYLTKKYYKKNFDKDGRISGKGKLNESLFNELISKDHYFKSNLPKSTGREYYNEIFLNEVLERFSKIDKKDIIRTFTEFTCFTIYYNFIRFVGKKADEIYVSGGGAKNKLIIEILNQYFEQPVSVLDIGGINTNNKEAVLFALLAYETMNSRTSNIKQVTGADKNVILGKICYAK
ncbi:MAG: anhydro-N-acetylmuramic acid kinase [Ignavibacteria bacterium]|nr:anhydro-N-acetylmuramic acid kinase [Ignavibacteria bacterium]